MKAGKIVNRCWLLAATAITLLLSACGSSDPVDAGLGVAMPCVPVDADAQPTLAADGRPQTIPALRQWRAGTGTFVLCQQSRLLIAPEAEAALRPVATSFAEAYALQTGRRLGVAVDAASAARPGDFSLGLGDDEPQLGAEGYRLQVGASLAISARTAAGAYYGTVSLLQLLKQAPVIAQGEALDWPSYPQRGLMIDLGRKYFTQDWLAARIRDMAWLKLNYLHLHISDNPGFRVESLRHPEITSEQHLTQAEVRDLVALATRAHITVVGEIGMPGHMQAVLARHPEFQLAAADGTPAPANLDITQPAAVQFAKSLIDEFLPLFPSAYWHAGGDEFLPSQDYSKYPQLQSYARTRYGANAVAKDAVLGFMNDINDYVRSKGRIDRVWNDGLGGGSAVTLATNAIVEWWTDFTPLGDADIAAPQALLDQGYTIMNASYWPTYYTIGGAAGFPAGLPPKPDNCSVYREWTVSQFTGPLNAPGVACIQAHLKPSSFVAAAEPHLLGAKLHVWADTPDAQTEQEVAESIAPRLRWLAQAAWETPKLSDNYADFEALQAGIGPPPGNTAP